MLSKEQHKKIEKRKQEYEKKLNKKIKGEKVPPQDDKSSAEPIRKPIQIKNDETAYEKYIFDKQEESEKILDKLNAPYYNTPKSMANRGRTLGLNTRIIDNYTENPKREPEMSYAVPLYYTQNLPEGWRHNVVGMDYRQEELIGLSYWTGPLKYKDSGFKKPFTINVTIFDYPSKKRLEEEAEYYELTNYKGKYRPPLVKNLKKVARLMDKFDRSLIEKIDKRRKDLEGEYRIVMDEIQEDPQGIRVGDDESGYHLEYESGDKQPKEVLGHVEDGGKSFFEEGVKTREHEKKPSKIFGYKWEDFKVGGRKRKTRRKQKGGNTANCETAKLSYVDLANKIEKMLEVKVPNWWQGMNDGPYKLVEYNVEDQDAAQMGQPGIFGIGLETPDGQNGFFIPKTDIENETVRLCAPSVDNDTAPAGGRRKKRRRTRKNKRSKKKRVKKRKTRKKRRKRR